MIVGCCRKIKCSHHWMVSCNQLCVLSIMPIQLGVWEVMRWTWRATWPSYHLPSNLKTAAKRNLPCFSWLQKIDCSHHWMVSCNQFCVLPLKLIQLGVWKLMRWPWAAIYPSHHLPSQLETAAKRNSPCFSRLQHVWKSNMVASSSLPFKKNLLKPSTSWLLYK